MVLGGLAGNRAHSIQDPLAPGILIFRVRWFFLFCRLFLREPCVVFYPQDAYKEELAGMIQSGYRAEIEALYFNGYDFLSKYIAKKIVQANYI